MTDLEIREQIAALTRGEMEPPELEDRLEGAAWDLEGEPARTLAADALRLLAEHANGDWTDAELREKLGTLSRIYWFKRASKVTTADSTSVVIHQDQRSASSGRLRVAESV